MFLQSVRVAVPRNKSQLQADAVQHFYEPFLAAYDPDLRRALGVWYTPPEIVRYMVERVDRTLRDELGIRLGFAIQQIGEEVFNAAGRRQMGDIGPHHLHTETEAGTVEQEMVEAADGLPKFAERNKETRRRPPRRVSSHCLGEPDLDATPRAVCSFSLRC